MYSYKDLEVVKEFMDNKNISERDFIKQCLSVIAILLGLIVSLRTNSECINKSESLLFIITISLSSLCILFGLTFLYSEIHSYKILAGIISKQLRDDGKLKDELTTVNHKWYFLLARFLFYTSLFSSFFSLIIFAIIREIPF